MDREKKAKLSPAIQRIIAGLYPKEESSPDVCLLADYNLKHMKITSKELRDALEKTKPSAPGNSRISAVHLRQLLDFDPKVLQAFTIVANIILLGEEGVDDPFSPAYRSSWNSFGKDEETVLNEADTKIMPIGVNEVFLNLIAKIALQKVRSQISNKLHKHDLGFNRAGGTEGIVHATQAIFNSRRKAGKEFVLIQTDVISTFRKAIFQLILETCPELLPFARFRYENLKVSSKIELVKLKPLQHLE